VAKDRDVVPRSLDSSLPGRVEQLDGICSAQATASMRCSASARFCSYDFDRFRPRSRLVRRPTRRSFQRGIRGAAMRRIISLSRFSIFDSYSGDAMKHDHQSRFYALRLLHCGFYTAAAERSNTAILSRRGRLSPSRPCRYVASPRPQVPEFVTGLGVLQSSQGRSSDASVLFHSCGWT